MTTHLIRHGKHLAVPLSFEAMWYTGARMTKTMQKLDISRYMVKPPARRKKVDWRDYVIPSKSKKKTNWSERVDEVVYGAKKR